MNTSNSTEESESFDAMDDVSIGRQNREQSRRATFMSTFSKQLKRLKLKKAEVEVLIDGFWRALIDTVDQDEGITFRNKLGFKKVKVGNHHKISMTMMTEVRKNFSDCLVDE